MNMKKKYLFISWICFWILAFSFNGVSQKQHPYLFYTTQRIDILKKRMKSDSSLLMQWNNLKGRCDKFLIEKKGASAEQLAFAYVMTNDRKYADLARDLLNELVNKSEWDGMDDRTPRWNSGLNTSHTNWIVSIVYDAIYNTLSKDQRKTIAEKILKLGIEPSISDWLSKDKRIHSLNSMGHNWWASVVFGAGNACLAVMNEIPEAKKWASDIMESSKEWFAFSGSVLENKIKSFDEDGGFYESISYANYALSEYLQFRLAWSNVFGTVKMPYDGLLQKTMDWFIESCYPRDGKPLMSLNFGDSNDFANGERIAKLLIALGLGKEEFYWYLKYSDADQFREAMGKETPMGLLYEPETKEAPLLPGLHPSALYSTMGWGMLRNSWKPNATLLGIKCGYTWNHSHADAGSFVLYHNGEYLLIDGGDVGYGNPEYSSYFVTSRAHNVILFNNVAQDSQDQYHAVKTPGQLYHLIDGGNLKYMLADATGPTSRNFLRNYRNFLWIGNVIFIIDDLKTYDIGQFDFLLHYQDKAEKRGPDIEITKGNSAILFRPLYPETLPLGYPHDFPEKMKYTIDYGLKDRTTDIKIPYYKITPPEKTDRTKLVNAIILLDENNEQIKTNIGSSGANGAPGRSNIPVIEKFEGNDYLGLRITQNGQVTEVYVNLLADGRLMHRNSNININGWETDAYICALTFPENADKNNAGNLASFFVSNGSYLRKESKVIFSSLSKVFMNVNNRKGNMDIQINGQPLIHASLSAEKISSLKLNNEKVSPKYDSDKMLLIDIDEAKY